MARIMRRALLAAAGTLVGVATARKLWPEVAGGAARAAGGGDAAALSGVGGPAGTGPGRPMLQDIAALQAISPPVALPALSFTDAEGHPHTLADYPGVAGHGAVLNLWATWCPPCVAEMPSLAALHRTLAASGIPVLAVSADRGGAPVVQGFFRAHGIQGLPVLLDPHSETVHALGLVGLPTTLVIGPDGRERGRLEGSADWGTPEAAGRIRALLG